MRVLYCPSLFEERKSAYRFSYSMDRAFCEKGHECQRMDYRGTGEAAGSFAEVSLETIYEDIARSVQKEPEIFVCVRFGAALVSGFVSTRNVRTGTLVMIEPVLDGKAFLNHMFRKQRLKDAISGSPPANDEGFTNIEGYKTNNAFLEQVRNFDFSKATEGLARIERICFVLISKQAQEDEKLCCLQESLRDRSVMVDCLNLDIPPFWERIPIANHTQAARSIVDLCCD